MPPLLNATRDSKGLMRWTQNPALEHRLLVVIDRMLSDKSCPYRRRRRLVIAPHRTPNSFIQDQVIHSIFLIEVQLEFATPPKQAVAFLQVDIRWHNVVGA